MDAQQRVRDFRPSKCLMTIVLTSIFIAFLLIALLYGNTTHLCENNAKDLRPPMLLNNPTNVDPKDPCSQPKEVPEPTKNDFHDWISTLDPRRLMVEQKTGKAAVVKSKTASTLQELIPDNEPAKNETDDTIKMNIVAIKNTTLN